MNRVAKEEVGEKMIVCGRAARWWDSEVKDKINSRREMYKKVINGNENSWEDYCKLRTEVKELVRKKKVSIWNEVVEKVNADYEGSKKEFWAFVGRRTKGKKKAIESLRSDSGVSVNSTKGKLQILQKHYEELGRMSVDSDFDIEWKEQVELEVSAYGSMVCEDEYLDREIQKGEIEKYLPKLKNNKTGGSDGLVGELLKYGGAGMVDMRCQLFRVVWCEESVPRQWREGLIVNLFKKGDKEDPGNYRGITLYSVVGKVFCKVLNNR